MLNTSNEMRLDNRTSPDHEFSRIVTNLPPKTQPEITLLFNSINWYFFHVFILCENHRFILVVQSKSSVYFTKQYKSLNAAKKAFSKLFLIPDLIKSIYKRSPDLKPLWNGPFQPDKKWLDSERKLLDVYYSKYKSQRPHNLTVYLRTLPMGNKKGDLVTIKYIGNRLPLQGKKKSPPAAYTGYKKEILIQGEISMLLNSSSYNLECVYIKVDIDGFRLVAFHQNQPILNKLFKNPIRAKVGFLNKYRGNALKSDVKPIWSHFYYPAGKNKKVVIFNPYLKAHIQLVHNRGPHAPKSF